MTRATMSPAQAPSGMGCSLLRCPSPAPPLFPIGRATCLEIEFQRWTNACCTCRVTIYFALVLCRQSSPAHPWHRCCHCSAGEGLERIQFGDFPLLFLCAPFHPSLMRDVLPILFKGHVMGTPAPAAAPLPFLLW